MKYSIADNKLLSGRADGNVYFRNHVIRGFVMPSRIPTASQTTQTSNFSSLSASWNTLTESERAGWNALQAVVVDRMGHNVTLSGKALYIGLNRNLFNSNNAAITAAPVAGLPAAVTSITLTSTAGGGADNFSLAYTPTPVPAGVTLLVFGTKEFSAGTYSPSPSQYRFLGRRVTTGASPISFDTKWRAMFGAAVAGGAVFAKVIVVNNAKGWASAPVVTRTLVV